MFIFCYLDFEKYLIWNVNIVILIIQWEFLESHTLSIKCARWDVELNTIADLRLKELYIELGL